MATKKPPRGRSSRSGWSTKNDHAHQDGGQHAQLGFQYECAMRCLWLLELHTRGGTLVVSGEEDCDLTSVDGTRVLRQVKKREGDKWTFTGGFRQFIERAHLRFSKDPTIRHEFYTHVPVSRELVARSGAACRLNPEHSGIKVIAGGRVEEFCGTISLFDQEGPPDPREMRNRVMAGVRAVVDNIFGDPLANDAIPQSKVGDVANRLLAVEFGLLAAHSPVSWAEVAHAVGVDALVRSVEARARGGDSIIPWHEVDAAPDKWLDEDGVVALGGVKKGLGIRRPQISDFLWSIVTGGLENNLASKPGRDLRLVLLLGPRGAGKTWLLLQLGHRLATERPETAVCVATGSPPREWGELSYVGIGTQRQHVILVDELFPDWSTCFSIPLGYLPDRVVFVATAAEDAGDPEVMELRQRLGRRLEIIEVAATPTEEEMEQLAQTLRTLAPAARERRTAARSNFRHAVEILTGCRTGSHLAELERLFGAHVETLTQLMACSALRVPLPLTLVERMLGRAIPTELRPWVVLVKRSWGVSVAFEDEGEADALLERLLVGARSEMTFSAFDTLLEYCDAGRREDRLFARQLFSRLIRRQERLALRLTKSRMHFIEELIATEPMWALASCWLPLLGRAELTQLMELAIGRMRTAPETVAEFCLWVEAYGAESAARFLSRRLPAIPEWDCSLVIRYAAMVRNLPRSEQRRVGRQFTRLFMDLPAAVRYQSLGYKESFPLLAKLTAGSAVWFDRNKAVEDFGRFLTDRGTDGLTVPQNWYEAYFQLVRRMLGQERNGVSLAVTRDLLAGHEPHGLKERYEEVLERERTVSIGHLVTLGVRLLRDYATGSFMQGQSSGVPSNTLKLAAAWAEPAEFEVLVEQYLVTLQVIAGWGVPVGRVAAVVTPAAAVLRKLTEDQRRTLFRTIFHWLPTSSDLASEETGKFIFRVCRSVAGQPWVSDDVALALKDFFRLLPTDPARARLHGVAALTAFLEKEGLPTKPLDLQAALPDHWIARRGLAMEYIVQAGALRWDPTERSEVAESMMRLRTSHDGLTLALCAAMLRLRMHEDAARLAESFSGPQLEWPEVHALLSIAAIRRGDLESAYASLATIAGLWDRYEIGLEIARAHWMHREFASCAAGWTRSAHAVCAELAGNSRLASYDEVLLGVRPLAQPVEVDDDDLVFAMENGVEDAEEP